MSLESHQAKMGTPGGRLQHGRRPSGGRTSNPSWGSPARRAYAKIGRQFAGDRELESGTELSRLCTIVPGVTHRGRGGGAGGAARGGAAGAARGGRRGRGGAGRAARAARRGASGAG